MNVEQSVNALRYRMGLEKELQDIHTAIGKTERELYDLKMRYKEKMMEYSMFQTGEVDELDYKRHIGGSR